MSKVTLGEALARRKLKTLTQGNTLKYLPGQDKVSKLGEEDAIVSFVDNDNNMTIIPMELNQGEWFYRGAAIIATPDFVDLRVLPRRMPVSSRVADLLKKAYEKEEAPPPEDTTAEEPQPQGQER